MRVGQFVDSGVVQSSCAHVTRINLKSYFTGCITLEQSSGRIVFLLLQLNSDVKSIGRRQDLHLSKDGK